MHVTDASLGIIRMSIREQFANVKEGHGQDHLDRVEAMALRFMDPSCDRNLASAIALLHDADDYKLFPSVKGNTPNASRILDAAGVDWNTSGMILDQLSRFGFSRRLKGLQPDLPEAMAVSDADMCDIMGAVGILRLMEFDVVNGIPFFDEDDVPDQDPSYASYMLSHARGGCRHMFDKVLRLPDMMLTESGRREAVLRRETNIAFLYALFRELDVPDWTARLDAFLSHFP